MSTATLFTTTITIDRSGRLVIPKSVRAEAGIEPGTPLSIRVRDGRIEIEPSYGEVRFVEREGFQVAERAQDEGDLLTSEAVRQTVAKVRERNLPR